MRANYDFSTARKNPYAAELKKPVTIRLDQVSISYFKSMSEETGIPYQSLINLYLKECASSGKRLTLAWKSVRSAVGRTVQIRIVPKPAKMSVFCTLIRQLS